MAAPHNAAERLSRTGDGDTIDERYSWEAMTVDVSKAPVVVRRVLVLSSPLRRLAVFRRRRRLVPRSLILHHPLGERELAVRCSQRHHGLPVGTYERAQIGIERERLALNVEGLSSLPKTTLGCIATLAQTVQIIVAIDEFFECRGQISATG